FSTALPVSSTTFPDLSTADLATSPAFSLIAPTVSPAVGVPSGSVSLHPARRADPRKTTKAGGMSQECVRRMKKPPLIEFVGGNRSQVEGEDCTDTNRDGGDSRAIQDAGGTQGAPITIKRQVARPCYAPALLSPCQLGPSAFGFPSG